MDGKIEFIDKRPFRSAYSHVYTSHHYTNTSLQEIERAFGTFSTDCVQLYYHVAPNGAPTNVKLAP